MPEHKADHWHGKLGSIAEHMAREQHRFDIKFIARINAHNIQNLDQLLPWNWEAQPATLAA